MHVLLNVACDDEYGCGPEYFRISLSKASLTRLITSIEMCAVVKEQDGDFYDIRFYDYGLQGVCGSDAWDAVLEAQPGQVEVFSWDDCTKQYLIADTVALPEEEEEESLDRPLVEIDWSTVRWSATLRKTYVACTSLYVDLQVLKAWLTKDDFFTEEQKEHA